MSEAMAMVQWVRVFTLQVEGWVFESQPWQTSVIKTGSDSSKCSAIGASVTQVLGDDHYKQMPHVTESVAH